MAFKKVKRVSHLYFDDVAETYYVVKRMGDDVRKKAVGSSYNDACGLIDSTIQGWKLEIKRETKDAKVFADFYHQMIEQKKADDVKPSTLRRIHSVWEHSLKPYWEFIQPAEINQPMITDFINWHRQRRPGRQLVNVFKYLGNVFTVMVESEVMQITRRPKLPLPKSEVRHHNEPKGRAPEAEEVGRIMRKADPRTELQILIGFTAGMRKMEIGSLPKKKVERRPDGRFVLKLSTDVTKTGIARIIPLPGKASRLMEEALAAAGKSEWVFPMPTDPSRHTTARAMDVAWAEAKEKAEISERLRFHDLRHGAATAMARSGINPAVACTILGMSLSTFQKKYLKLAEKDLIIGTEAVASMLLGGSK